MKSLEEGRAEILLSMSTISLPSLIYMSPKRWDQCNLTQNKELKMSHLSCHQVQSVVKSDAEGASVDSVNQDVQSLLFLKHSPLKHFFLPTVRV